MSTGRGSIPARAAHAFSREVVLTGKARPDGAADFERLVELLATGMERRARQRGVDFSADPSVHHDPPNDESRG